MSRRRKSALGEAVGKLYVERMFAGSSKEVALEMIGDIKATFEAGLPDLAGWTRRPASVPSRSCTPWVSRSAIRTSGATTPR